MNANAPVELELDDIQAAVVHPRPAPYVGRLIVFRVDDRRDGRDFLGRLIPHLASARGDPDRKRDAWATVAFTFQGLKALGVPDASLATFPEEFRQGMAARSDMLGDTGESAPPHWEQPLGTGAAHLAIYALAPDTARLDAVLAMARAALADLKGVTAIWEQGTFMREGERTSFGFKDGISQPAIEGSGIAGSNPLEAPLKAGEFVLGYPGETGVVHPTPQPEALGHNGSYVVFRKLHTNEAAFRAYIRSRATSESDEALVAAKIVGRWPSGAPLTLCPERDDPELGADPTRNNTFLYDADDAKGLKCPLGAHARRMNPRDSNIVGVARIHRMIRRSSSYGPPLPDGVIEDDGVDRGLLFCCIVADLARQFEFVQTEWINSGSFIGAPDEKDPMVGPNEGTQEFTIPRKPIRRRLSGLPQFVVNRGGEYCFMPGLSALRWIAGLQT